MKAFASIRTLLSGQTQEAFGLGHRFPLTKQMQKEIRSHMSRFSGADLSAFTFERRQSSYGKAKSDLVVYDGQGAAMLKGREMEGGLSFWD